MPATRVSVRLHVRPHRTRYETSAAQRQWLIAALRIIRLMRDAGRSMRSRSLTGAPKRQSGSIGTRGGTVPLHCYFFEPDRPARPAPAGHPRTGSGDNRSAPNRCRHSRRRAARDSSSGRRSRSENPVRQARAPPRRYRPRKRYRQ